VSELWGGGRVNNLKESIVKIPGCQGNKKREIARIKKSEESKKKGKRIKRVGWGSNDTGCNQEKVRCELGQGSVKEHDQVRRGWKQGGGTGRGQRISVFEKRS